MIACANTIAPRPGELYREDLLFAQRCVREPTAQQELFRRYAPGIFRLARHVVGHTADAEDVLQEVFLQALRSIQHFRGEASLGSWLNRLAVRSAWRHLRRSRRKGQRSLEVVGELSPAGADPARRLESRAALARLQQLLDRIAARRRVAFVLHHVEGYPLAEAAALMGISETAAKKMVWRARSDLARLARRDPLLGPLFRRGEP